MPSALAPLALEGEGQEAQPGVLSAHSTRVRAVHVLGAESVLWGHSVGSEQGLVLLYTCEVAAGRCRCQLIFRGL